MMPTMTRQELRKKITAERKRIPESLLVRAGEIIQRRIVRTAFWTEAEEVWLYISKPREVGTGFLLEEALRAGRRVAAPRVEGSSMDFYYIGGREDLRAGAFGLLEPSPDCPKAAYPRAAILMPGLAFDPEGNRLGYGRGYYDRYLTEHPGHPTCAAAFDFSILADIEPEEWDVRPDFIVTERRILCSKHSAGTRRLPVT